MDDRHAGFGDCQIDGPGDDDGVGETGFEQQIERSFEHRSSVQRGQQLVGRTAEPGAAAGGEQHTSDSHPVRIRAVTRDTFIAKVLQMT